MYTRQVQHSVSIGFEPCNWLTHWVISCSIHDSVCVKKKMMKMMVVVMVMMIMMMMMIMINALLF